MRFWVILLLLCAISFATAYRNRKTKKEDGELPPLADGDSRETPTDDEEPATKTVSKKKIPPKKKVSEEEEEETEDVSQEETKHTDKKTNKSSKGKTTEKKKSDKTMDDDESELGCSDSKDENPICDCELNVLDCAKLTFENQDDLTTANVEMNKKNFNVTTALFSDNAIISLKKGKIVPGRESEIEILKLNANRIKFIDPGAFEKFTNLKKLYLENNKISRLTKDMFKGLGGLHHLHLSNNTLTTIEEGVFSELKSLKRLDLDGNKLVFKKEMFTGLESLEELSLDNTGIDNSIPVEIFDLIPNLKMLSLRNNKYTEVPRAVNALSKLQDLDLSGSSITEIHGQSFKNDHGVKYIRMTKMPYLYSIQDCAFCGLEELEEIDLSNSPQLYHIHENAFGYATTNRRQSVNLKKINLENCNITAISEELLYYDTLEQLGIGGNPINCTCETTFLMNGAVYDFEYTNNIPKCKYPKELAGQPLAKLEPSLACPGIRRGNTVWRGVKVLSIIFLLTLVTSGVFMLYSRGLLQSCYKSARHGAPAFPSMTYANLNNTDDGQSLEQDFQPRPEQV